MGDRDRFATLTLSLVTLITVTPVIHHTNHLRKVTGLTCASSTKHMSSFTASTQVESRGCLRVNHKIWSNSRIMGSELWASMQADQQKFPSVSELSPFKSSFPVASLC